MVEIDDGVEDDNESIDHYMTFADYGETYLDVLRRLNSEVPIGHPQNIRHEIELTVEDNYITSIVNKPVTEWSWWDIYTQDLESASERFADQPATRRSRLHLVYNQDSDHDYYSDRIERRIGTDRLDPDSHPSPVLVAGILEEEAGDNKLIRLKLSNTGNYDAYGIDAILYSPDGTTFVLDSLIGGGGRIEAGRTFIPDDTFQFAANVDDYSPPVVLVRYNDPQGPHVLLSRLFLDDPDENIDNKTDQMLAVQWSVSCSTEFSYYHSNWLSAEYFNPGPAIIDASITVYYQHTDGTIIDTETSSLSRLNLWV